MHLIYINEEIRLKFTTVIHSNIITDKCFIIARNLLAKYLGTWYLIIYVGITIRELNVIWVMKRSACKT
jgi:hypothetical protein